MVNVLRTWRARFGIAEGLAAAALGISADLYARIECGEVEPELDLAVRIHVLTAGVVPTSSWPTLTEARGAELEAIATKGPQGWGVSLVLGSAPIAWLTGAEADRLAAALLEAGKLAKHPPRLPPVLPKMELHQ